jgi:STE24 endopeptidase
VAVTYSLRTGNLSDAFAGTLVRTAEYWDPLTPALQEAIFYLHPSVGKRVQRLVDWKSQQLQKAGVR